MILEMNSVRLQAASFVSKATHSKGLNLLLAQDNVLGHSCDFFPFSVPVTCVHGPANSYIIGSFSLEEVDSKY